MRRIRAAVIAVIAALLFATGCATKNPSGASGPAPAQGSAAAPASPGIAQGPVTEIDITIRNGQISPKPAIHKVHKGDTVKLVVTSDTDDWVHVHGFDQEAKLTAGQPAVIEFVADHSGVFVVETHTAEKQLLQLQVS